MTDSPQYRRMPLYQSPTWSTPRHVEQAFWIFFILLPIFTGWLRYDWLPNESFDKSRHDLLRSHEVCRDEGEAEECSEMADVWGDKQTGQVYTREEFATHRHAERWRMLYMDFSYGLAGCLFFGVAKSHKRKGIFFQAFGKAVCVNIAVVVVLFLMVKE